MKRKKNIYCCFVLQELSLVADSDWFYGYDNNEGQINKNLGCKVSIIIKKYQNFTDYFVFVGRKISAIHIMYLFCGFDDFMFLLVSVIRKKYIFSTPCFMTKQQDCYCFALLHYFQVIVTNGITNGDECLANRYVFQTKCDTPKVNNKVVHFKKLDRE